MCCVFLAEDSPVGACLEGSWPFWSQRKRRTILQAVSNDGLERPTAARDAFAIPNPGIRKLGTCLYHQAGKHASQAERCKPPHSLSAGRSRTCPCSRLQTNTQRPVSHPPRPAGSTWARPTTARPRLITTARIMTYIRTAVAVNKRASTNLGSHLCVVITSRPAESSSLCDKRRKSAGLVFPWHDRL